MLETAKVTGVNHLTPEADKSWYLLQSQYWVLGSCLWVRSQRIEHFDNLVEHGLKV